MIAVLKPTYSCNLRCTYCYLPEEQKSKVARWHVSFAKHVLTEIVQSSIKRNEKFLTIIWHGGEPLLWGVDNFKTALSFLRDKASDNKLGIRNIVQTNLTLISREYIELFQEYNVAVSFSIDGFEGTNDLTRVFPNGSGTFATIISKIKLCQEYNIKLSCIVVGNKNHIGKIHSLFDFMNNLGIKSFKFNPIFNTEGVNLNINDIAITPDEYAEMVIELFNIWYYNPNAYVVESNLVEMCSNIVTQKPTACQFKSNCQELVYAISPEGEACHCGRFCDNTEKYSMGNIKTEHLFEILANRKQSNLYNRTYEIAKSDCGTCVFFNICNGGCPHDALTATDNPMNKTFLCEAYKKIYSYLKNVLKKSDI